MRKAAGLIKNVLRSIWAAALASSLVICLSDASASTDASVLDESTPLQLSSIAQSKSEAPSSGKLFTTLGVICGLAIAGALGLRRWAKHNRKQTPNTRIQILTQHHLGPKKSLAIIQVAGEALLIGVTDQNISMLKTLSLIDDEVPDLVPKNFSDVLDDDESSEPFHYLKNPQSGRLI